MLNGPILQRVTNISCEANPGDANGIATLAERAAISLLHMSAGGGNNSIHPQVFHKLAKMIVHVNDSEDHKSGASGNTVHRFDVVQCILLIESCDCLVSECEGIF